MSGPRSSASTSLAPPREAFPSLTEGENRPSWPEGDHGSSIEVGAPGVGVDRLSFSFPVSDWLDLSRWDRVTHEIEGGWSAQTRVEAWPGRVGSPGVMVGVRTVAGEPWGKVECNPSRFADPGGCTLLDPRELEAAGRVMWAAACEVTRPSCSIADARVKRVDVARDFRGVTSPALYVEGLGPIKRPWARRQFTYNDPGRANAETLFVGSKSGGVRLYDQHAAYSEKGAPEGSLRWECEARDGWLEKWDVRRLADLDPVAVDRLASDRWEWSKMGSTVTGPVNAVQVMQRQVDAGRIKQQVADRLLGAMLRQSFGIGAQAERSERRYRALSEELGLTTGALWSNELDRQAVGRLEFSTGTEELSLCGSEP